jgi:DNA-binding IclR family transcriptional regulator
VLARLAKPYASASIPPGALEQLCNLLGEFYNLNRTAGDRVIYLDRVEASRLLRVSLAAGCCVPLHCTGSSPLFLAEMPPRASMGSNK